MLNVGVLVARIGLSGVFLLAALTKGLDQRSVREAASGLGVRGPIGAAATFLVIPGELLAAMLLVPTGTAAIGAAIAAALLAAFTLLLIVNLAQGRRPACHCFGSVTADPITWLDVIRNLVLLALASGIVLAGGGPSLVGTVADALLLPTMTALVALAFGAALMVMAGVQLLEMRNDSSKRRAKRGWVIPRTTSGRSLWLGSRRIRLGAFLGEAPQTVLVFADPSCGSCLEVIPELADLVRWRGPSLRVAVLTSATPHEVAPWIDAGIEVIRQRRYDVRRALGVRVTPAAVLVSETASYLSDIVVGPAEVRNLCAKAIATAPVIDGAEPLPARRLDPGAVAPSVLLTDQVGRPRDLSDFVGSLLVLVFVQSQQPESRKIVRDLQRFELEEDVALVVVDSGVDGFGPPLRLHSPVLRDPEGCTTRAFGIDVVPSAILLDAKYRIASQPMRGDEIADLLSRAAQLIALARDPEDPRQLSPAPS